MVREVPGHGTPASKLELLLPMSGLRVGESVEEESLHFILSHSSGASRRKSCY